MISILKYILLFVYYGQDTWASTSIQRCHLQRMRPECMRIMKRLKDRRKTRRGGAVRTEARQVLPHPAGGQVLHFHYTSHITLLLVLIILRLLPPGSNRCENRDAQLLRWALERYTVAYTPCPTFASCAGFPASDTSFAEHRSMPKHVSEQTIWLWWNHNRTSSGLLCWTVDFGKSFWRTIITNGCSLQRHV